MQQLSGLDATFLYLETPEMTMHVGALHVFQMPPGYRGNYLRDLRRHLASRLPIIPVMRKRLWWMPLNLANPAWVDAEPDLTAHVVEVTDSGSAYGGYGYGGRSSSRFDKSDAFDSLYETPGWQRARAQQQSGQRKSAGPMTIDGDLVARSTDDGRGSRYAVGERVFHLKFGYGTITSIEGNKLSIEFEKAGPKKVLESFVQKG